ncbi:MAG: DUF3800 domain-containing protein [Bacteroidota bacterium]
MAYFLFIDESGSDGNNSPYEVLCGLAVEDRDLWNFINQVQILEEKFFGKHYGNNHGNHKREIKGKDFLKKKVFRLAAQMGEIDEDSCCRYAKQCLENGESANRIQLTSLAQAKLRFVESVLEICSNFRCKIFSTISKEPVRDSDDVGDALLRRDYIYLLERFFYFLEDRKEQQFGIIVFDEIEKTKSKLLIGQMDNYFKKTVKGKHRSSLIIPEPFFVHSDLTTGIQIVDIIAYLISWGWKFPNRDEEYRSELSKYLRLVVPLRNITERDGENGIIRKIYSVVVVK